MSTPFNPNDVAKPLLDAARRGDWDCVRSMVVDYPTVPKYQVLLQAISTSNPTMVDFMLRFSTPDDLNAIWSEGDLLLNCAMGVESLPIFDQILPLVDCSDWGDAVFYSAIRAKNPLFFKRLEQHLPDKLEYGVMRAVEAKRLEILPTLLDKYTLKSPYPLFYAMLLPNGEEFVKTMIPYASDENLYRGLCKAVEHNPGILDIFLEVCDPKDFNSKALFVALEYEHFDVAEILAPLSDPMDIVNDCGGFQKDNPLSERSVQWLEEWVAQDLKKRLSGAVGHVQPGVACRKM